MKKIIVYKITNNINQKYYIGVHKTDDVHDNYMGSGVAINRAIKKYGSENFKKEVLFIFNNESEAYDKEIELLENIWNEPNSYNMMPGGVGSWDYVNTLGFTNPMKNPEIVKKHVNQKMINGSYHSKKFIATAKKNLEKAMDSWTGSKHSEESKKSISDSNKKYWAKDYKSRVQSAKKYRNRYLLSDPNGVLYELEPGYLIDFCVERGFSVSTFSTKEPGYTIKRGKARGWKLIDKN